MKTKSFFTTAFLCLLVGISITVYGAIKQDRNVGSFTKIEVSSGIDLHLTQGSNKSVSIETEESIMNKIETVVENGTLKIRVKSGEKINWTTGKLVLIAHVTTPTIEGLQASGGSDIIPQTPIKSSGRLDISLSGGSDLKDATIDANELNLKQSGGSDSKQLTVTAKTFTANISGGSDIKNGNINAPTIDIKQSGGSDATLKVSTETLIVNTSGGSDITLSGKTNSITANASGAASVKATGLTYVKSDVKKSGGSDIKLSKQ